MFSEIITIITLTAAGLITGSILFWTIRLGIGPTPTSGKVRKTIKACLPDTITGDVVELGSGWGHLIPVLKEKYPDLNVLAYERSPLPAWYTAWFSDIDVKREDFFEADHRKAGLIVCYLFPGAMERVENEIIPQLSAGCWILTHTFRLPERVPVKTLKASDLYQTQVYLYRISI